MMNSRAATIISRDALIGLGRLATTSLYLRMSHFSGFFKVILQVYSLHGILKLNIKNMLFLSTNSTSSTNCSNYKQQKIKFSFVFMDIKLTI